MENKNKKVLKILGVGAIASVSLLSLAGCSISDAEKADMMQGLKNANSFMEETINQLRDQNENLEDCINTIRSSTAQEEAYNRFSLAVAKFKADFDGVRSNVKANVSMSYGDDVANGTIILYRSSNNGYINMSEHSMESNGVVSGSTTMMYYENDNKVWLYNNDGTNATKEELTDASSEAVTDLSTMLYGAFMVDEDITKEDIKFVEILDNGNYVISVVKTSSGTDSETNKYEIMAVSEYEITPDCKFVKVKVKMSNSVYTNNGEYSKFTDIQFQSGEVTIEYGVVEESYINSLITRANRATVSSSSIVGE